MKYVLLHIYFCGEGLHVFVKEEYWKKKVSKDSYVLVCEITSSAVGCSITWLIQVNTKGV